MIQMQVCLDAFEQVLM